MPQHETEGPDDDILLLPWRATARLSPLQARLIARAVRCRDALARDLVAIRREQAAVIDLNERLGAPSPRTRTALFAAIAADRHRTTATQAMPAENFDDLIEHSLLLRRQTERGG